MKSDIVKAMKLVGSVDAAPIIVSVVLPVIGQAQQALHDAEYMIGEMIVVNDDEENEDIDDSIIDLDLLRSLLLVGFDNLPAELAFTSEDDDINP